MNPSHPGARPLLTIGLSILAAALLIVVTWVQYSTTAEYRQQLAAAASQLNQASGKTLGEEKTRQEALKLRLDNEQKSVFLHGVLSSLSTSVGLLVALAGMWVGFAQYLGAKDRERLDRASSDLEKLWEGVAKSDNPTAQAAAIASLQHFLSADKSEYHDRVAAALALVSRMERRQQIVNDTLRPVVEKAMKVIPESMRRVSWQGARIDNPDFSGLDLSGFDFRDSSFVEGKFLETKLIKTRFDASNLLRSDFEAAQMQGACLEHANLADASLRSAILTGANLLNLKVQNLDIGDATLLDARLSVSEIDWKLISDWRSAKFTEGIKDSLLQKYGPPVQGPRVLILLWEFLPKVSGGLWTAVYHLIKSLRARGADLWIAVPHSSSEVSFGEFGNEIHLLTLGGKQPIHAKSYTSYSESGRTTPGVYTQLEADVYSAAAASVTKWFTKVSIETIERDQLKFDLVHAHDWLTFPAAEAIAKKLNCPWIAHFHSTESDRRGEQCQGEIEDIEKRACTAANAVVTPSVLTRDALGRAYGVSPTRITVIPNCLSTEEVAARPPLKNRERKNVVFMGRLATQKGPDRFVQLASAICAQRNDIHFLIHGSGELEDGLKAKATIASKVTYIVPPPEIIPPTTKNSPQRLGLALNIDRIAPAHYDDNDQLVTVYGEKAGKQGEELVEFVLSHGFTMRCFEKIPPYTHLIGLKQPVPEGVREAYCIRTPGLPTIKAVPIPETQVVRFCGQADWSSRKDLLGRASVIVVPSRSEPFGMIILEAMQLGIPVLYEATAGAGEILTSGVRIRSADIDGTAASILNILDDEKRWLDVATAELEEIAGYTDRAYEKNVADLWATLLSAPIAHQ